MAKSIMQDEKVCYICGNTLNLHLHHIYFGVGNRSISHEDGCVVYLCQPHHTGNDGVHHNRKLDLVLKVKCQIKWQEKYNKTKEDFIARFGRSYL